MENIRRKRLLDGTFVYRRNKPIQCEYRNIYGSKQIWKYWLNILTQT